MYDNEQPWFKPLANLSLHISNKIHKMFCCSLSLVLPLVFSVMWQVAIHKLDTASASYQVG